MRYFLAFSFLAFSFVCHSQKSVNYDTTPSIEKVRSLKNCVFLFGESIRFQYYSVMVDSIFDFNQLSEFITNHIDSLKKYPLYVMLDTSKTDKSHTDSLLNYLQNKHINNYKIVYRKDYFPTPLDIFEKHTAKETLIVIFDNNKEIKVMLDNKVYMIDNDIAFNRFIINNKSKISTKALITLSPSADTKYERAEKIIRILQANGLEKYTMEIR